MTAPKNNKARKAWLAGLKSGDEVALVPTDGYESAYFHSVTRRSRWFSIGRSRFSLITGDALCCDFRIAPITDDMRRKKEIETLRSKIREAMMLGWRLTEDHVLAISAILWPETSK